MGAASSKDHHVTTPTTPTDPTSPKTESSTATLSKESKSEDKSQLCNKSGGCPYKQEKPKEAAEMKSVPMWAWGCPHRGKKTAEISQTSSRDSSNVSTSGEDKTKTSSSESMQEQPKQEGGGCPYKEKVGNEAANVTKVPSWAWGCPHRGKETKPAQETSPKDSTDKSQSSEPAASGCPVLQKDPNSSTSSVQYNVYSQPLLDPSNQMPSSNTNQLPSPHQTVKLSTSRESSTIPKGGASDGTTWTYPSPQMFYNALVRKNKDLGSSSAAQGGEVSKEEVEEEQGMMETVVQLHNAMNEYTWTKILQWEDLSNPQKDHQTPKLLKFCGRPTDLSPKARIKHVVLNHPLPFDRHDWTVERSDGTQVRYVIDYYHNAAANTDKNEETILVDVRPAVDGPKAVLDRMVVMPLARRGVWLYGSSSTTGEGENGVCRFEPLPMNPSTSLQTQKEESEHLWTKIVQDKQQLLAQIKANEQTDSTSAKSNAANELASASAQATAQATAMTMPREEAQKHAEQFATMLKSCQDAQRLVDQACSNDADDPKCAKASLGLTMCMAKLVCPLQYEAVQGLVQGKEEDVDGEMLDAALERVTECVVGVNEEMALAKKEYGDLFRD